MSTVESQRQGPMVDTAIVWFRRDLRLYDNPALTAALQAAHHVVPVYIWTPEEEGQFQPGRYTRWWSKQVVTDLEAQLQRVGSRLILKRSAETLPALLDAVRASGASAVYFNNLYDAISMVRDQEVKKKLDEEGVRCYTYNADLLYEPWAVMDVDGQPFTAFAPFWNRCINMHYPPAMPISAPSCMSPVPLGWGGLRVDQIDWFFTADQEASAEHLRFKWDPTQEGGHKRLEQFLSEGLPVFEHDRAKSDRDSTTMLSPWIHFGCMSVRYIYYRVAQRHAQWSSQGEDKTKSCLDFLQQLGYREYSRYLAFHYPFITERSMLAHLRACPFKADQARFKAWRQGQTGYPLIDATMKQLCSQGWCHNRLRVVVASFLVKNLLVPWQWGLKHLWDCQIDADLECDALGWQYVSGCLTDAHPFSYMIDLEKECARFDPDGEYVRRWLPQLSNLSTSYIHKPWRAAVHVLDDAGVELGFNYPLRLVNRHHSEQQLAWAASIIERASTSSNVQPRKQPYRPPTDPDVIMQFLARGEDLQWNWTKPEQLAGTPTQSCERTLSQSGITDTGSNDDEEQLESVSGSMEPEDMADAESSDVEGSVGSNRDEDMEELQAQKPTARGKAAATADFRDTGYDVLKGVMGELSLVQGGAAGESGVRPGSDVSSAGGSRRPAGGEGGMPRWQQDPSGSGNGGGVSERLVPDTDDERYSSERRVPTSSDSS